jgi:hypothetical protein
MPPKKKIEKEKLFLVEGADAYYFFIWACQVVGANDIQVMDFGGVSDLGLFLKTLKEAPEYDEKVSAILIARDAETNPNGAIESIKTALRRNGFAVPEKPFSFEQVKGSPHVAYMVLPGFHSDRENGELLKGALEDLCLSMSKNDSVNACVDVYINCLESKAITITHPHKTRVHAYLAGKGELAGLKLGEAAKAGAWDWDQTSFGPFRETIKIMQALSDTG